MKCTALQAVGVGMVMAVIAACEDKKPTLAPIASGLAPTKAPSGVKGKKFVIDEESATSIEMDAPKEKIRARTRGGTGTLDVDFSNLANSRGEVKMDLSAITTHTFSGKPSAEADNKAQTTHARTWLQVGDGESGKTDEKTKEANRYAVYVIRSVENASVADVSKMAPTKDGGDEVRAVTLTTKGSLLVHGRKVERDADVEVVFRYDTGAAADTPKLVSIKTRRPLRVVLAEHDVKPRDAFGEIAKGAFHLLGTKVADNADVSLDLRAKPAP